jgi:hypothetical protein
MKFDTNSVERSNSSKIESKRVERVLARMCVKSKETADVGLLISLSTGRQLKMKNSIKVNSFLLDGSADTLNEGNRRTS